MLTSVSRIEGLSTCSRPSGEAGSEKGGRRLDWVCLDHIRTGAAWDGPGEQKKGGGGEGSPPNRLLSEERSRGREGGGWDGAAAMADISPIVCNSLIEQCSKSQRQIRHDTKIVYVKESGTGDLTCHVCAIFHRGLDTSIMLYECFKSVAGRAA